MWKWEIYIPCLSNTSFIHKQLVEQDCFLPKDSLQSSAFTDVHGCFLNATLIDSTVMAMGAGSLSHSGRSFSLQEVFMCRGRTLALSAVTWTSISEVLAWLKTRRWSMLVWKLLAT
ncbi:unnamed protein product [Symbiodinium microadriaticum]|nr:unnamed protein product [Symbiodinium microadriaticum]